LRVLARTSFFALDEGAKLVFSPNLTATYSTQAKVGVGGEASLTAAFRSTPNLSTKQS
jgi:hypothetical protein